MMDTRANARRAMALAAIVLALACLPVAAADPSVDEMIEALSTKPAAPAGPRTRSITRSGTPVAPVRREGKLQLAVQFEFASAQISPQSREVLLRLASAMKSPALSGQRYRIEGHTDIVGSVAANQRLSERRALAVTDYLKSASGIEPVRFSAWGLGSSTLANLADPRAAENRRVVVISMEPLPAEAAGLDTSASVQQAKGSFSLRRKDAAIPAQAGTRLQEGDVLSTPAGSSALVKLDDGASLLVRSETELKITRLKLIGEPGSFGQTFELLGGAIRYVSGSLGKSRPDGIAFRTNAATIGIRGTDFDIVHTAQPIGSQDPGTYVKVNSGAVSVGGLDGSTVQVAKDEQAYAG
ncbi:MAG: OmpA family protein, partial [Pseudomonadota bacterium]